MKVYIGKYPHWFSAYRFEEWAIRKLHNQKYFWDIKEEEYTKLDKAISWTCDKVQDLFNVTINKIGQKRKIKIRIDKYDTWSMDHTLGLIILPMLIQLRDTKHGMPWTDDDDVPEELKSTNAEPLTEKELNNGCLDKNAEKRWDWILNEMIFAFSSLTDDNWDDQFYSGNHDIQWDKDEETGLMEMKRGPKDTFEIDHEGMKKDRERRRNGLRLFGKYYETLWD